MKIKGLVPVISYSLIVLRFSKTPELWSSKVAFTNAFLSAVNHNYDHITNHDLLNPVEVNVLFLKRQRNTQTSEAFELQNTPVFETPQ